MFEASCWVPHTAHWSLAHQPTNSSIRTARCKTIIYLVMTKKLLISYHKGQLFKFYSWGEVILCQVTMWCVTRENTILFSRWSSVTKLWQLSVQIIPDCSDSQVFTLHTKEYLVYINIVNHIQHVALWQYFTWELVFALNVGHHTSTRKLKKNLFTRRL